MVLSGGKTEILIGFRLFETLAGSLRQRDHAHWESEDFNRQCTKEKSIGAVPKWSLEDICENSH
jgi:hypothetical protein